MLWADAGAYFGKKGVIEDLRREDLKNYPLQGTEETIPLFGEVLDLFAGKTPLIVELKSWTP